VLPQNGLRSVVKRLRMNWDLSFRSGVAHAGTNNTSEAVLPIPLCINLKDYPATLNSKLTRSYSPRETTDLEQPGGRISAPALLALVT
jgi:hypothetical protein